MKHNYLITFEIKSRSKNKALLFAYTIIKNSNINNNINLIEIKKSTKEEKNKILSSTFTKQYK